jgi:hypothetical protein
MATPFISHYKGFNRWLMQSIPLLFSSAVVKSDISTLTGPNGSAPSSQVVEWIEYDVQGFTSVRLDWDATTDDEIAVLSGQGVLDWTAYGGLVDPASTGATGDIVLTTAGASATATYTITIGLRLKD